MHAAAFAKIDSRATLAQLVERLIRNQQVASSILAGGSIFIIVNSLENSPTRSQSR
jgi:hypothetical protein